MESREPLSNKIGRFTRGWKRREKRERQAGKCDQVTWFDHHRNTGHRKALFYHSASYSRLKIRRASKSNSFTS
jgi:hypothetical protein